MRKALLPGFALVLAFAGCRATIPGTAERPEVRHVQVNETVLSYVEEGRGIPVAFVHGSAGDWRIWENQRNRRLREVSLHRLQPLLSRAE